MNQNRESGDSQWDDLTRAWGRYRVGVEASVEVLTGSEPEPGLLDRLTHRALADHGGWSETLGMVMRATHPHR